MNYLDLQRREAHREGVTTGMWLGCCIGIAIMIGVHLALSMRADTIHEGAQATIRAADALLMAECVDIVERTNSEPYETVRDYTREIDRKQGVVMPWTAKEEMQAKNQQGRK